MPQKPKSKPKKNAKKTQKRNWWKLGALSVASLLAALALAVGALYLYPRLFVKAPALPQPPLKDLASSKGIALGMLTQPRNLDQGAFTQVLTSQFSQLTSDGQIHWDKFRPSPTAYDFVGMDELIDFARQNNMRVEGHHLVWDEEDSLPEWLKNGNHTEQQLLDIMHTHITTVVGRYKGKVDTWTVVNEPFSRMQHVYGLNAWWADHLGGNTDYIDKAYLWARQADPDAKLILNDFYNETETPVADAQYEYMKSAKARGIPIDGIGIQMHIDAAKPPDKAAMIKNMRRFGELGFPVYITEFDVNSSRVKGSAEYKAQLEARITSDIARACVESQYCVSFTVFGMTEKVGVERFKWGGNRSYLFTSRYQPKPSFNAFREAWLRP